MAAGVAGAASSACTETRATSMRTAEVDSTSGEVRFQWAGPGGAALTVPAHINGHGPVDLLFDTGATMTCVDTALARAWELPERRAVRGVATGLGGSGAVRLVAVDSLRIGAAVARDLTICATDLRVLRVVGPEVRGLLGLNVLRNYRVTLDFEREVVRLEPLPE
ncbi:MAG: Aspartyl protease [Geminicoccaceae bacterium]|nr:Aspartyl protease [Geminicoccaceae bacterium]